MRNPVFPRRLLPKPELEIDGSCGDRFLDSAVKPFRLLDLPKEIRLIVYEKLAQVSSHRHVVPLRDRKHHITLVNPSIPGVHILATCRFINKEAASVLKLRMDSMLKEPPKMMIEATHLIGLIPLRDGFRWESDVLDRILQALVNNRVTNIIHHYRNGRLSIEGLHNALDLRNIVEKGAHHTTKAIASFILHAAKHAGANVAQGLFKYPPITIVISIPASFQSYTITTTTSRMMILYDRLTANRRSTRTHTGQARLSWLVRRFAFHTSDKCRTWKTASFNVMLKYLGDRPNGMVPQVVEHGFQTAIILGVHNAWNTGKGLVCYGGVVDEEDEEVEPVRKPRRPARTI